MDARKEEIGNAAPPLPKQEDEEDDWEQEATATTSAFVKLRLIPPPPVQDGGAFQSQDAFLNDQPVSPATASAASAQNGPLDPVLIAALENPRERLTLLKFEDQIMRFVRNSRESQLVFPPLSSYHRLLIYRLAQRCALEHQTSDYNMYTQGYDGNASRVVTVFRTAQAFVPRVLLIDLASDRQQPTVTPASAPKIMMRKRNAARPGANGGRTSGGNDNKGARSMQDRERAYAEARARIFGEETNGNNEGEAAASSSSTTAATTKNTQDNSAGPKLGNHQASGPDGSKGFNKGRKPANAPLKDTKESKRQGDQQQTPPPPSSSSQPQQRTEKNVKANPQPKRNEESPSTKAQNWKESKVLWRNREQELNDPDFTRNHDAYRPHRAHDHHGPRGYGPPMTRYTTPPDYYHERPNNSGYGPPVQPPLPGRRMHPVEYTRVDHLRPPPPPDYYRQNAPPLPGSGTGAPMMMAGRGPYRGGYGAPPPPRAYRGPMPPEPSTGGYNEEFPPLGGPKATTTK